MATKLETIERDGKQINIYDNGMEQDADTGKIIKPPSGVAFNSETGKLANNKRQEKFREYLGNRLTEVHNSIMPNQVTNGDEALAESLAMIHEQVVLNPDAYPRDRLEATNQLTRHLDLVIERSKKEQEDAAKLTALTSVANVESARLILRILNDIAKLQAGEAVTPPRFIDGKLVE
jgi:hypothetical protein